MMTSAIVQTARQQSNDSVSHEIPPSVLVIGKKHAGEYLAPALFRLSSEGRLEIRARGSLSIVTAVDVAELVRRNVRDLAIRSIKVGTEEIVIEGINKRMSTIEIALSKQEQIELPVSPPQLPVIEVLAETTQIATAVEIDPASIVDKILAEPVVAKKKRVVKKKTTKKTAKKRTKAKSSSD